MDNDDYDHEMAICISMIFCIALYAPMNTKYSNVALVAQNLTQLHHCYQLCRVIIGVVLLYLASATD